MGGIVVGPKQWADYDRKWARLRKKHLFKCFHSKELKDGDGEFKNWSRLSKQRLIVDLDKHQNKNSMFRFVTVVNKSEFNEHYKIGASPKKFHLDSLYGICSFALELVERSIGLEDNEFNFIVENGANGAGACPEIVNQLNNRSV